MDLRIEVVGDRVICRQDSAIAFSASLKDFLHALAEQADAPTLSEAIPEGVCFIRQRRDAVVLVLEEKPQVRTVQWLKEEGTPPFGYNATYRTVRLAFPFVVLVIVFRGGGLTGYQQCFYRTAPLTSRSDSLLLPNLYNVAPNAYGQMCWLCLANLQTDLRPLTLLHKVREIRKHLWGAGFNRSSEIHEGRSYWTSMKGIDDRVERLDRWEKATREDPFFPLRISWKPAGTTVGQVVDDMLSSVCPPVPQTVAQLAQLISLLSLNPSTRGRHA
jgi:hypothetical protein